MIGFLNRELRTKPDVGCEIDWGHPQAAGVKLWHVLNEGTGAPRNLVDGSIATVTGSPTWASTVGGIGRTSYGTAAYDAIDPAVQVLGSTYPFAQVYGFRNTNSSARGFLGGQTSTSNATPASTLAINGGLSGTVVNGLYYFARGDNNTQISLVATGLTINDGLPHVVGAVSRSPTQHEIWVDAALVATSGITLGTVTAPNYTLGALRRTSVAEPFLGTMLWHMAFAGAIPDMAWLAAEPYAAILPPTTRRTYIFLSGVTFSFAATLANQSLSSGMAAAAPPSRTTAFSATLVDDTLASSITTVAPASRTTAFTATLADQSLASSVTTVAPVSRTTSFSATVQDQSLSSTITAAAPGTTTVAFSVTTADQSLSSSVAAAAPASRTVGFASSLAGQSLASSASSLAAGSAGVAFAASTGDTALAGALATASPPGRTVSFAATLASQGFASHVLAPPPADSSHVVLQGFGAGSLVLQGYYGAPAPSDSSHVVLQGFGAGGSLVLQGYGPSSPPVVIPSYVVPASMWRMLRRKPTPTPPPPPIVPSRDYDILEEIQRLLIATDAFAEVRLHAPEEYEQDGADHEVIAFVEEVSWEEDSDADDEDSVRERRDVTWQLTIILKDENPVRRYQRLSQLVNLACNTLNGVSYLEQTVRGLSRLSKAEFPQAYHPYREAHMTGQFALLMDGYDGHYDETDDIDLLDD